MPPFQGKHIIKIALLIIMWIGSPPEQKSIIGVIALLAYIVDRHGYKMRAALEKIREELHAAPRSQRSAKKPIATNDKKD